MALTISPVVVSTYRGSPQIIQSILSEQTLEYMDGLNMEIHYKWFRYRVKFTGYTKCELHLNKWSGLEILENCIYRTLLFSIS